MPPTYATHALATYLPPVQPTPPAIFSVPLPSGGFDYYQAPPGSIPAANNDWPLPNVAHPNPIGVSSLHLGRALPPGSVKVGSGHLAEGSITAMPGAGGEITGIEALGAKGGYRGFGAMALDSRPFGRFPLGYRGYGDDVSSGAGMAAGPDEMLPDFSDPTVRKVFAVGALVAVVGLWWLNREGREERAPSSGRAWA